MDDKKDNNIKYNPDKMLEDLMMRVDEVYDRTGEIKATAEELELNPIKVKKLLVTSGKLVYAETAQIQRLLAYGKGMAEIQKEMGLKKTAINSYLPYSKVPYKGEEVSKNAKRCKRYREKKAQNTDDMK